MCRNPAIIAAAGTPPAGSISREIAFSGLDQIVRLQICRRTTAADPRMRPKESTMLFICSINWTDQGIRNVKDSPKRAQAARDLAKKVGVELKEVYLTSGDSDLVAILDAPNGDNVAKFAMAIGAMGNVRTRTARAWTQTEMQKLISELP
jgi:uncharacterized protein with GYD domain